MRALIADYEHRTGEHCASTGLRNLLHFYGLEVSEPMVVGLSGGLGFHYLRSPELSPTRMFHGRTATLESDFCRNAGIPFEHRPELDDARALDLLRQKLDAGIPLLISTDTRYLGYHNTTSHFPGHIAVVVGYDDDAQTVQIADRKFEDYQTCSYDELRRARNADDYPVSCHNGYGEFLGDVKWGRPLAEAVRLALRQNAEWMLAPSAQGVTGIAAMRQLAADLPTWGELDDWSWSARFGYQIVIKRGAGGSFFRSLYADFLREAAELVPEIGAAGLPQRMDSIASRWRDLAGVLKEQSERDDCAPALFEQGAALASELADHEESFFEQALDLAG
jgi:hypothetical protein